MVNKRMKRDVTQWVENYIQILFPEARLLSKTKRRLKNQCFCASRRLESILEV